MVMMSAAARSKQPSGRETRDERTYDNCNFQ
jgi:hypothetical protein